MANFNFLGQNINVGKWSGWGFNRLIITEMATGFSLINFINENMGGFVEDSASTIFKDSYGQNIFAIAYQHTNDYGLSTFIKVADANIGLIEDGDKPPKYAPWNDWIFIDSIADPDNITLQELVENSFMFFQQDETLYPYYVPIYGLKSAYEGRYNAPVNFVITTKLMNYDLTVPVDYTGPTPYLFLNGGLTNRIYGNEYDCTDPSYGFSSSIGFGEQYVYNPLYVDGSDYVGDFVDDTATTGGGYGNYGYNGNGIDFDDPISLDALSTGFISMYSPTKAQLRDLHSFLWSSNLVDNLIKAVAQPMDSVIMFGIVPLDLSSIRSSPATEVYLGNVATGVSMYELTKQRIVVDMGYVDVPENGGTALDYEPFTVASCYLPFIGFVQMKLNEIMKARVKLKYTIDLFSGDCIAQIKVMRNDKYIPKLNTITYVHRGNCLNQIPLTGADYSRFYKALAMAPLQIANSALSGDPMKTISGVAGAASSLLNGPEVMRSGNYSGSISGMVHRTPCILLHRPIQHFPKDYNKYVGFPCYIRYKLKDLTGFTMIDSVIDNTVSAPDDEKAEIERLLKEGVIL